MVERGERTPSDEKLLHLARVLQLDARKLLALKYEGSHPAAFDVLLAAPRARFPRLRKLLLASCENQEPMTREFDASAYGLIEHLVFHALLDRVLLPGLRGDPYAPRRLRERILAHRELHPGEPMPTAAFEEEAETFIPWVRGELPMLSWRLDPSELRLHVSQGGDDKDRWSFSLTGRDVPSTDATSPQSGARASGQGGGPPGPGLREQLREEGLGAEEVKEVLDLIEWKKARIKQRAEEPD